jgi:hypothetical protein
MSAGNQRVRWLAGLLPFFADWRGCSFDFIPSCGEIWVESAAVCRDMRMCC